MLPIPLIALASSVLQGVMLLISYISNNNAFPQPLPEGEELEYLKRMEAGEETARNILVEHNLRLVAHIVKKFDNTGQDNDDLISIGTIGLIKAIKTFDRHKKTRLATYAARCIENEILMHLRAIKRTKGEVMLYDPIGSDREGNEIRLIDILGTTGDVVAERVEDEVEQSKLYEKIRCLNRREKRVLELRYGLANGSSRTQREISRILGISRSYVSRIEKRAILKLQKEMYADGYR